MRPGAECRSNDPWRNGTEEIGNPDDRIPEDRLRARGSLEKEDAKEEEAERGGRAEKRPDQALEEEPKNASPGETPKGREGPEEPKAATSQEGRGSARYGPI
ncbi:hypothetical protein NDU88_005801 [Pleurodeles waltl]|uniref:Uncharacterized protein n=1 Tax=Pleurodeles waltl TaxID=8319 RepID=A0AAV7VL04_PLEWA|nr:hypothetical protein NDU88_005801 [Pleurodeles waltl]